MIRWTREVHHIFDRPIIPGHKILPNLYLLCLCCGLHDSMNPVLPTGSSNWIPTQTPPANSVWPQKRTYKHRCRKIATASPIGAERNKARTVPARLLTKTR